MLLDSNIMIYSTVAELSPVVMPYISEPQNAVSLVSKIEVLGFHKLNEVEKLHFDDLFARLNILPTDETVAEAATLLRQQKSMSLGDAIIAATALIHELPLVTRNAQDFRWIDGLELINPFE